MDARTQFLVLYDYSMGGLWAFLRAGCAADIARDYPELQVVDEPPQWMTDDVMVRLEHLDIDAPPAGMLLAVLADR